ncbi:hypothetical protein BDP55DRAFT_665905 [Colletotrichum godetiae]|uniref:Uncharacterized protein n=1 Tax=Colletotrichum godetiae TaxID=1209918 RepID=A0AAJ0ALN3_9PEZI|nr:uncharacterized protein BDP55DRAFT_665905 [Colletotrichum godetiae]KAK1674672.1 hypothetical protein BDP55DRAFT_665905 [Colletotrichum godetiae]
MSSRGRLSLAITVSVLEPVGPVYIVSPFSTSAVRNLVPGKESICTNQPSTPQYYKVNFPIWEAKCNISLLVL